MALSEQMLAHIRGICDERDLLRAENAKLRSQCADLVDERERLFQANVEKNGEVLRLVNENANLRELVRILYYCNLPWKDCDKCAMNGADMHVKISDIEFCDGMYDRMRVLGVEVDK